MKLSRIRTIGVYLLIVGLIAISGCSGGSSPVTPDERLPASPAGSFAGMAGSLDKQVGLEGEYWEGSIDVDGKRWVADIGEDGEILMAVGEGIEISGEPAGFIDSHPDVFGLSSSDLWLVSDEKHDGIRYVIYFQSFNGIPVLDTRVDLRYGRGGKLVMLGSDIFDSISDVPEASISSGGAIAMAAMYHEGEIGAVEFRIKSIGNGVFIPVWRIFIGDWLTLVSAVDGSIIEDTEMVWEYDFEGEVNGEVNQIDPLDATYIDGLGSNRVRFPGNHDEYTDLTGAYHYTSDVFTEVSTQVRILGSWVNVNNQNGPDAEIIMDTFEGVPAEFLFDSSNTDDTETNVYYWSNASHDYIVDIDPNFTGMDFRLTANVNRNPWCNANASGNTINFYRPASGCLNFGQIADVIIHEYAHVATHKQYNPQVPPPSDMREGFSDILANTMTDQPIIGINYKGQGTHIRNSLNNKNWQSNNCGGGAHCLGEILAGAVWDLRVELGQQTTDHLWWFARWGYPMTFPGFVTELCIVDDDNDNLLDGTPNYTEIYNAFKVNHGIPVPSAPDYVDLTLTVVPDTTPVEISNSTGGSFGYEIQVHNNLPVAASVEGWVAAQRPNGQWYGPIIPPGSGIGIPVNLNFGPSADFSYHLTQNIPSGLPIGAEFLYKVRLGEYVDMTNDDIVAEDGFTFMIVP